MIHRPEARVDRLAALLAALAPAARLCATDDPDATLAVLGAPGSPAALALRLSGPAPAHGARALAAAAVTLGGPGAVALHGAPALLMLALDDCPDLAALAAVFVREAEGRRCGHAAAAARLAEAMVAMTLRRVVDGGGAPTGLLAGLAHPRLHRALAAMHEAPGAPWTVEALAGVAGMSRSRFMAAFSAAMGQGPAAYLAAWRLWRAWAELAAGRAVKDVARRAGYGSAAAFSRAFARAHGTPPGRIAGRISGRGHERAEGGCEDC